MDTWPRISLVIPSYNQGTFIEATLRSVLDQEYPDLELLVIDGGSTDDSVEIIRRCADRIAYWVSEPDDGQTYALIKGFERATGAIQGWLCTDDLLEPDSLRDVAQFFAGHPGAEVVYGDAIWIDVAGRPIRPKREIPFNRFIWTYDYNYIPQPSTFWRKTLYDRVGGLDTHFDLAMDADLWARFADATRIYHVRRYWSRVRVYPQQKTLRLAARSRAEDRLIRERWVGSQPDWAWQGMRVAAKSVRVAWKLVTGCYGPYGQWPGRDRPPQTRG